MTLEEKRAALSRYLVGAITAEQAADELGPHVSVAEVVLATRDHFGRLPDRDDDFSRRELRRGLELLGIEPQSEA